MNVIRTRITRYWGVGLGMWGGLASTSRGSFCAQKSLLTTPSGLPHPQEHSNMEDDRAQVDLGIAVDIEERQEEAATQRQPKKRFVGRRQAAEAASRNGTNTSVEDSGAVTSTSTSTNSSHVC